LGHSVGRKYPEVALSELWEFLKDETNRSVLTMIGSSVAVVFGGIWAAVTFLFPKSPQPAAVTAIHGGIAAGGQGNTINIHQSVGTPAPAWPPVPSEAGLGALAQEMLLTAAGDGQKRIWVSRTISHGTCISVGRRSFTERGNDRLVADCEEAIRDLCDRGLVRDADGTGQAFEITAAGYRHVESTN
jgi:hypothetical protein